MEAAGIDIPTYNMSVAHGIHSITIQDIKSFFGVSVTENNGIPTANPDLLGDEVLPNAPSIHLDPELITPVMQMMDFILTNNDDKNKFMVRGLSSIEKLAHVFHMYELWAKTAIVYKEITGNPPEDEQLLCGCLTDEVTNGIHDSLGTIFQFMKNFRSNPKSVEANDRQTRSARKFGLTSTSGTCGGDDFSSSTYFINSCYNKVKTLAYRRQGGSCGGDTFKNSDYFINSCYQLRHRAGRSTNTLEEEGGTVGQTNDDGNETMNHENWEENGMTEQKESKELPELTDSASWARWKSMLKLSMMDDKEIFNLAMYLHCKLK